MQAIITLKAGKERPLLRRHPWVYSNAIERVDGKIYPGATVQVLSHEGKFIANRLYSLIGASPCGSDWSNCELS